MITRCDGGSNTCICVNSCGNDGNSGGIFIIKNESNMRRIVRGSMYNSNSGGSNGLFWCNDRVSAE